MEKITKDWNQVLKEKVVEKTKYGYDSNDRLFEVAKLLLPYIDDEPFFKAFDYMRCKLEHQKQLKDLRSLNDQHHPLRELSYKFERDLRRLTGSLMEEIRYGKRNENIDDLLKKLTALEGIFSSRKPNITVNTDGEARCKNCNIECMSSYRILFTKITKIVAELEPLKKIE